MLCYRPCPLCGAALDPGERCDCQDKEAAPRATNSGDCQEEGKLHSTSILPKANP